MPLSLIERQQEAYCSCCPTLQEVERSLQEHGFTLVFQMHGITRRHTETSIPAQYHFTSPDGTEILYLAGRDVGDRYTRLRPHASRFWVIMGNNPTVAHTVMTVLAARFGLQWQESERNEYGS